MATVEMVGNPADGTATPAGHFHAAEFDNITRGLNGHGVLGHTLDMTVTDADRIVTIPAMTYLCPDGSGNTVQVVKASSTNVMISAADPTDPRTDIIVGDSSGNITATAGTPTEETGDVEEAPVPALLIDEVMFAKVRAEANTANIASNKVVGRALDISENIGFMLVGSNTVEATTTSATPSDMVTITGLNILVTTPILLLINHRKSSGAAAAAHVGLKINSTVTAEADAAGTITNISATDQAENGLVWAWIGSRSASYLVAHVSRGTSIPAVGGGAGSASDKLVADAPFPNATITDVIIRGASANALNTLAIKEVLVYALVGS